MPKKAFIVYTPADRVLAVKIWDELNAQGVDVGIDLADVPQHLERRAVLEDMISVSDLLILVVSDDALADSELRRMHLLALEQDCDLIAVQTTDATLPPMLATGQRVKMRDVAQGLPHLMRLIPADFIERRPDTDKIIANLHHPNANVRRTTLFLVGSKRMVAGFRHAMALVLTDEDSAVRAAAAWALDQLANVEAAPALLYALYDTAFEVRSNAGWGLVNLGRRRDAPASRAIIPAVIAILRESKNVNAREMAYLILIRLGGRQANDAIDRYWNNP